MEDNKFLAGAAFGASAAVAMTVAATRFEEPLREAATTVSDYVTSFAASLTAAKPAASSQEEASKPSGERSSFEATSVPEHCPGVDSNDAGKGDACAGCPNKQICASGEAKKVDPAVSLVSAKLSDVKRKILVLSGKGGVGKSTVSAQLAFSCAGRGLDVGLLDVDICGPSMPQMLGLADREVHQSADGWSPVYVDEKLAVMSIGFMLPKKDDAIIWRGPKKNGLIKQFLTDVDWGTLDVLLVDTPPGTSDEHLSIVSYLQEAGIDGAVVVTTPQEVALADVRKEINFCKKVGIKVIGVVENMSGYVCANCDHATEIFVPSTGGAKAMCQQMDVPYLGALPMSSAVVVAGEKGIPLRETPHSDKVQSRLNEIVHKVLTHVELA